MTSKNPVFRHEIKYLIDIKEYFILKSRLSAILTPDIHSGKDNRYHIRSLYFDDMKNTDLFAKLSGLSDRKKFRLRIYDQDMSLIRMEKKEKRENTAFKISSLVSYSQANEMIKGNFDSLFSSGDPLFEEIYSYHRQHHLTANVITDYDREAYIFKPGNVRITFDSNLRTALSSTDLFDNSRVMIPVIGSHQKIVEVKYDNYLPGIIQGVMRASNGIQLSISKFALCKKYTSMNDWEVQ